MTIGERPRWQWALFGVLCVYFTLSAVMLHAVESKQIDVTLSRDTVVRHRIFRPSPHPLYLAIKPHHVGGQGRGSYSERKILLLVSVGDDEVVFEASPESHDYRNLFPLKRHGSLVNASKWDSAALIPMVPSGLSTIEFKVIDIGSRMSDASATLIVKGPIDFKTQPRPGYGWLWLFAFSWPVFALILVVYGTRLLWRSLRTPATRKSAIRQDALR